MFHDALAEALDITLRLPSMPQFRRRLSEKQLEYEARKQKFLDQHRVAGLGVVIAQQTPLMDAVYKAALAEAVLLSGQVRVRDVYERLRREFGGHSDDDAFINAVRVLYDYMTAGGGNSTGGTGFLTDPLFHDLLRDHDVLIWPDDPSRQRQLRKKYHEYLGRQVERERNPETSQDRSALLRDGYKARIIENLRHAGQVSLTSMAHELMAEERERFNRVEYYRAAAVIRSYLADGGTAAVGGTGL
jgi:hypothetical protein